MRLSKHRTDHPRTADSRPEIVTGFDCYSPSRCDRLRSKSTTVLKRFPGLPGRRASRRAQELLFNERRTLCLSIKLLEARMKRSSVLFVLSAMVACAFVLASPPSGYHLLKKIPFGAAPGT